MHLTKSKLLLTLVLAAPFALLLASCGGKVDLSTTDQSMAKPNVTEGAPEPLYPNDTPSSADGQVVWQQNNCAQCHADGHGGSAGIDLTNKELAAKKKPVDQYMFVAYGVEPGATPGAAQGKHPAMFDKLTTRQIWDLVFYVRSLSLPVISDRYPGYLDIDALFGSNCVVCHGKKGFGDGPLAHNLEPVPANFKNFPRFYDRTDDVLWDHIANGLPWEGMPNFLGKQDKLKKVKFDKEYIWKLVQYVRHFQSTDQPTIIAEGNKLQENGAKGSTNNADGGNKGQNQSKPGPIR